MLDMNTGLENINIIQNKIFLCVCVCVRALVCVPEMEFSYLASKPEGTQNWGYTCYRCCLLGSDFTRIGVGNIQVLKLDCTLYAE